MLESVLCAVGNLDAHFSRPVPVFCLNSGQTAKPVSMRLCSTLCGQVGSGEVIHMGATFPRYNAATGAGFKEPGARKSIRTGSGYDFFRSVQSLHSWLERASEPVWVVDERSRGLCKRLAWDRLGILFRFATELRSSRTKHRTTERIQSHPSHHQTGAAN